MVASMGGLKVKGKLLSVGSFVFPALLLGWSFIRWLPLSLLVLVGVGWAHLLVMNTATILVQSHVPDPLRGRVLSIYTLSFFGMFPVGALMMGAAAQAIGEPTTVALGAVVMLAFAAWLWVRVPTVRALE
jgi:hypothetical protein